MPIPPHRGERRQCGGGLAGDQISIVLGGEWETYKLKVKDLSLTLSGGDLQKPVTLKKVGPPTPLPPNAKIPPDPDVGG